MKIENLQLNTSYIVNATIFNANFEYWHLMPTKSFKTLELENYWPQMISNDTIQVKYLPQNDSNALIAKIEWKPTAGEFRCIQIADNNVLNENYPKIT